MNIQDLENRFGSPARHYLKFTHKDTGAFIGVAKGDFSSDSALEYLATYAPICHIHTITQEEYNALTGPNQNYFL